MESGLEYLITAFTDVIFAYFSIWLFRNERDKGHIHFVWRRFGFSSLVRRIQEMWVCGTLFRILWHHLQWKMVH